MVKKILITGMAGSGKSTVCKTLNELGHTAISIEDTPGMFNIYHKGTRDFFEDYNNLNPEDIKNAEWLCDTKKLKELVDSQKSDNTFYCGVSSDMEELLPFFDTVIVLDVSPQTINERLKNREGTDEIGNNQEGRDIVLARKDLWDKHMHDKGAIFIDANKTPKEVAKEIIKKI